MQRKLCPSLEVVESMCEGHDAVVVPAAVKYVLTQGHAKAAQPVAKAAKTQGQYSQHLDIRQVWCTKTNVW